MYHYKAALDPYHIIAAYESDRSGDDDRWQSDEYWVEKMDNILTGTGYIGVPPEPTMICLNVFLGTSANGENLPLLKRMHITHVLNVDGFPLGLQQKRRNFYRNTGITYEELAIDDSHSFDIEPYFAPAHKFIDLGRHSPRGKVLICDSGVNRGGAIALSYMMKSGQPLLRATKALKEDRRVVLHHRCFMMKLVSFARQHGLLDAAPEQVIAPKEYGRVIDRHRIRTVHLPSYWEL